jgi:hypothetical protein
VESKEAMIGRIAITALAIAVFFLSGIPVKRGTS